MDSNNGISSKSNKQQHEEQSSKDSPAPAAGANGRSTNVTTAASLTARIGSSASSLARDVLSGGAGGANATTSSLASLASSEKASGSRSSGPGSSLNVSSSSWASNDVRQKNNNSESSSAADIRLENGFREVRPSFMEHTDAVAFENLRPNELMPDAETSGIDNASAESMSWRNQFRDESEDLQYIWRSRNAKGKEVSGDVAAVSKADGSAVVDILEAFDSLEEGQFVLRGEPQSKMTATKVPSSEDLFGDQLSSSEPAIRQQIFASLPRPREYQKLNSESVNNFRPNVEMLHMPSSGAADSFAMLKPETSLTSDEERREWMKQWVDEWDSVLHGYVDEVWGTDLPKVQQAKQEIKEMRKNESRLDDIQAVRRLKMILGHLNLPGG